MISLWSGFNFFFLITFNSVDIVLKKHVAYGIQHDIFSRWRCVDIDR